MPDETTSAGNLIATLLIVSKGIDDTPFPRSLKCCLTTSQLDSSRTASKKSDLFAQPVPRLNSVEHRNSDAILEIRKAITMSTSRTVTKLSKCEKIKLGFWIGLGMGISFLIVFVSAYMLYLWVESGVD